MMQPRPSSPLANTLEDAQHDQQKIDADGERPHAPVAKALLDQTSSVVLEGEAAAAAQHDDIMDTKPSPSGNDNIRISTSTSGSHSSMIPNLLSSGNFPPPPHSPRQRSALSMSPPTIIGSPNLNALSSPAVVPAAPPSTPYTPYNAIGGRASTSVTAAAAAALSFPGASSPALVGNFTLNHRPSSPPLLPNNDVTGASSSSFASPTTLSHNKRLNAGDIRPPNIPPISPGSLPPPLGTPADPHYNALLRRELHDTMECEKARIASLTRHETQNYASVEEYKHALSRERRHSTSLSMELTHYKFQSKYTSCNIHSAAEINEEARINSLIKNINSMKKDMKEDKCRVVMELEREEERIINGLMLRLEDVTREKLLLERQIGSVRGGVSGGAAGFGGAGARLGGGVMDGDEARLHARFERMMQHHDDVQEHGQQGQRSMAVSPERVADAGVVPMRQQDLATDEEAAAPVTSGIIGSELPVENANMEEDSEEEEEEEDENEDILEDRYHDPEMEEELANLLKMKESK